MEFHYSDICMPQDHLVADPYVTEYTNHNPYMMTGQREAEYEVRNSILVDGGDRFGVSAVVFDKHEELIWMGNQGGHVTSYYGPSMQKYTSFQVHETEEIRDITTHESGIFALTKSTLRHQIRRGLPKHTFKSPNMVDMQCLYQLSPTKLFMGGHQDKLIELDLTKMSETVVPISEEGCAIVRSGGGSLLACGSASGAVTLRDIRTPGSSEHTFTAHSACLSDLDMQGNLLITCGFTHSVSGVAVAEPYVYVCDVRLLRAGPLSRWSAALPSPPLLLHFLPAFSARAVAVGGGGLGALLRLDPQHTDHSMFQVNTQNSQISVMDVSATSQALVFGDQSGHIHLFSPQHNQEPSFNHFSRETEFADTVELPFASFNDTTFQYSSVPLPPLATGNKWFNVMPEDFFKKMYRKPKPIDAEVLKTMKMQGPIGYAPNPRTFKRNQIPYIEDNLEDLHSPKHIDNKSFLQPIPKQYQKMDHRFNKHSSNENEVESMNKTGLPGLESTIPNSYCNPMLQVLYYLPAVKACLLAHTCAKEFCLSCELGFLFRVLPGGGAACAGGFLRAFRTVPEAHALGLLLPDRIDHRVDLVHLIQSWNRFILHQIHYEILETRKKEKELALMTNANSPPKNRISNVASTNMSGVNLATSQGLNGQFKDYSYGDIEFLGPTEFENTEELRGPDGGWPVGPIQAQDSQCENIELQNSQQSEREETEISELFAIGRHQLNRCLKCNKEEERESVVLACALQYPPPSTLKENANLDVKGGFIELLLSSLSSKRSTPAWCEKCHRFSPTLQMGRVVRLPPILSINCGGVTAHEKAYWCKGTHKEMPEGVKRGSSGKPCRYGLHCARPGCRFKHPDRPGSSSHSPNSSSKSPPSESHCVLPSQLTIRLSAEGDLTINDKSDSEINQSTNKSENGSTKPLTKKKEFTECVEEYDLAAAVVCIEDNPKNLVAYVKVSVDGEASWYLMNDLSISVVPLSEVVQCSEWWKSPCVLVYCRQS